MNNQITITGTIESIKGERSFGDTYLVEFVVCNNESKRPHYYLLRAVSQGAKDKYKIGELIGHEIAADCYLNGRKSENSKAGGSYFSNDLHVRGMNTV